MDEQRNSITVVSRASGLERTFQAGRVYSFRRDPAADFPLSHEKVSRRAHAELSWEPPGWVLRDVTDRQGVLVDGLTQRSVLLTGPIVARLGDTLSGEEIELRPALPQQPPGPWQPAAQPQPGPMPAPMPAQMPTPMPTPMPPAVASPGMPGPALALGAPLPTMAAEPDGPAAGPWRLAVHALGTVRSFAHWPGGHVVSIGRDQACDIVLDHPAVSRHHADLVPVPNGWLLNDHSSGGSWTDGNSASRITSMLVDHSVQLRLGDPLTGALLEVDVLVPAEVQRKRQRRARNVRLAKIVTPVALVAVVASVLGVVLTRNNSTPITGMSAATLLSVQQTTVKLDIVEPGGKDGGWGSGTIISPDGLILTNSHVADPNAAGMATQYNGPLGEQTPAYLTVEVRGAGADGVVHPMYRAKKVIADGYLDLAVVRIYADAHGRPVNPATLHLPFRPIADPNSLKVGDNVTVVGFPGVSESLSATVNKGDASAFVHDARLHSNRAWIETSARIAHGNSGGSAVNDQGQLIGVPTRIAPEHEGDIGWWFRPVSWAIPLIAKARAGGGASYVTPYIKPAGAVTITPAGWATSESGACSATSGSETLSLKSGVEQLYLGVKVTGWRPGSPVYANIVGPSSSSLHWATAQSSTACWQLPVQFTDGDGVYKVLLYVDPTGESTRALYISIGTSS